MSSDQYIASGAIEDSLLIGYYGGGNFGDELLLEVLQNRCADSGIARLTIGYRDPAVFAAYHHDFGYQLVDTRNKRALLGAILRHKAIVIGGGGLWGLDFNTAVLLLCMLLFASRWLLGKRIYLLGVGYYRSTTGPGHVGAWLAAKAANSIVARDHESYTNFARFNRRLTVQDRDIAWLLPKLSLGAYTDEVATLDTALPVRDRTIFVALRHFQPKYQNAFTELIGQLIADNPARHFLVAVLEPEHVDPTQYETVRQWQLNHPNVHAWLRPCNPVVMYRFLHEHRRKLAVMAPQFHVMLAAHLAHVPFLPVVYDNKVAQLLARIGSPERLPISKLRLSALQRFIEYTQGGVG